jgi:hypothetical protein
MSAWEWGREYIQSVQMSNSPAQPSRASQADHDFSPQAVKESSSDIAYVCTTVQYMRALPNADVGRILSHGQ